MYHLSNEELQFLSLLAKLLLSTPIILGTEKKLKPAKDDNTSPFLNPGVPVSNPFDAESLQLFSKIFLGTQEKISIVPAHYRDKPNFVPGSYEPRQNMLSQIFTPHSLEAAGSFVRMFESFEGKIDRIDQLVGVKGDGNLIAIGSPTSNFLSRVALGYEEIGGGVKGAKHTAKGAFDLKIRYALDGEEILAVDSAHHYVNRDEPQAGNTKVLNWGIKTSTGRLLLPESRDGVVLQDYLLISCLPNTFNKHSYESGHRLLSMGGTHREGTKAIGQLVANKGILKELREKLVVDGGRKGDIAHWQALLLIDSNPATGSVSINNIMEFCPITIDETAIENVVQANHTALMQYGAKP